MKAENSSTTDFSMKTAPSKRKSSSCQNADTSVVPSATPVFPPLELRSGGRVDYMWQGVAKRCSITANVIMNLKTDDWLHGEVLFAYFLLAASLSDDIIALDSSVTSLLRIVPDRKLLTYPLRSGRKAILPLNVHNSHWVLALFDIDERRIRLFDSRAFSYNHEIDLFDRNALEDLRSVWRHVTDVELERIQIADPREVHVQSDDFNCGIFSSLYATRICLKQQTKQEASFTPVTLKRFRLDLYDVLVKYYNVSTGSHDDLCVNLPRMVYWNEFDERNFVVIHFATLTNEQESEGMQQEQQLNQRTAIIDFDGRVENMDVGEMKEGSENCFERSVSARAMYHDEDTRLERSTEGKELPHLVNQSDAALAGKLKWVEMEWEIVKFIQHLCKEKNVGVCSTVTKCSERSGNETFARSCTFYGTRLIIPYYNEQNRVALCMVERRRTWKGEIFDATIKSIRVTLRTFLTDSCRAFGLNNVNFTRYPSSIAPKIVDTHVTTLLLACHFIMQYARNETRTEENFDPSMISCYISDKWRIGNDLSQVKDGKGISVLEDGVSRDEVQKRVGTMVKDSEVVDSNVSCKMVKDNSTILAFVQNLCETTKFAICSVARCYTEEIDWEIQSRDCNEIERLIIPYYNEGYDLAFCIVERGRYWRGEIFDGFSKGITLRLRNFLKETCEKYGLHRVKFRRYKVDDVMPQTGDFLTVLACYFMMQLSQKQVRCAEHFKYETVLNSILNEKYEEILPEPVSINMDVVGVSRMEGTEGGRRRRSSKKKHSLYNAARTNSVLPDMHYIGKMTRVCKSCGAYLFPGESNTLCCKGGEVYVPSSVFNPQRDERLEWFWQIAHNNRSIFQMLRPINNMIACAAVNINLKQFNPQHGPAPLVLQGAYKMGVVNLTGTNDNDRPCFAQLYLADDFKLHDALCENVRNFNVDSHTGNLIVNILKRLISDLKSFNPIVQAYMTMLEVYAEELARNEHEGLGEVPTILMNIKQKREVPESLVKGIHEGRLNLPTFENQIASIYVCRDGNMPTNEELDNGIRVYSRGRGGVIPHHSYDIDAFSYPLLFPGAEQPFPKERLPRRISSSKSAENNLNKKQGNPSQECSGDLTTLNDQEECDCLTPVDIKEPEEAKDANASKKSKQRMFISRKEHSLFVTARRGDISKHRLLGMGKLFAQYVLHLFTRIEADRMSAIVRNRTEIRSATASAMYNYVDQRLREKGVKLGRLVTMPSSYVGSRNWCRKQYSVGMAVAQRLGKPDLFITFTGNSEWPEILENLPTEMDSWITEPLLCVRVFELKLKQFLRELVVDEIFGPVEAYQLSIEFQKRGMPHAHILVTLRNKFTEVNDVDSCISAVIPEQPKPGEQDFDKKCRLFECVRKFMVHGPCANREDLECRKKDPRFCQKHFPKPYREATDITEDGYPLYRRPDDGRFLAVGRKKTTVATNRDIVPYNAYLTARFGCHINVEVCTHIRSYKYIFKYIHKGVDQILMEVLADEEEVKKRSSVDVNGEAVMDLNLCHEFIRARFTSHTEGAFRICGFDLQKCSHSVVFLRPHLENEALVYFKEGQRLEKKAQVSPLLAYFQICRDDEHARGLTWVEVAEQYTYLKGVYHRNKKRCKRIARVEAVNPRFAELYALRKLLLYSSGVTSFTSLRTVNGHVYSTFVDAARASGYLEDSNEWNMCMRHAVEVEMPYAIRQLFAQIVMHCHPPNPLALWETYKKEMRSVEKGKETTDAEKDLATLSHIRQMLHANGTDFDSCGLAPLMQKGQPFSALEDIPVPHDKQIDEVSPLNEHTLNADQLAITETLIESVARGKSKEARVFFLYGKAGCGKTFLINNLITLLKRLDKQVIAVASTGIAATLLSGGRTAHSMFKLPIKDFSEGRTANVDASSLEADRFRKCDVIVWDEISMQSKTAIECVEKMLRDIAPPDFRHVPFGGVLMLFGGDWTQFLPVVQGGTKQEVLNETLKYSYIWRYTKVLKLEKNMRMAPGSEKFSEWLRLVADGAIQVGFSCIAIPDSMVLPNEKEVIEWIYTPAVLSDTRKLREVALLSIRNNDVLSINEVVLSKLSGETIIARGIDEAAREDDGVDGMPCENEEDLHRETPQGMPPYLLKLKVGCIIMLLRNMDVANQLCNGTRLQLLSIVNDECSTPILLRCMNLINNKICLIPRVPLDHEDSMTGLAFRRFQFPVRLSFCMTVNKSQGQTFEKVGIILRSQSFAHGCTYVALSRARRQENIKITVNDNCKSRKGGYLLIKNVVYKEVVD